MECETQTAWEADGLEPGMYTHSRHSRDEALEKWVIAVWNKEPGFMNIHVGEGR
jgi:hypothetical protein